MNNGLFIVCKSSVFLINGANETDVCLVNVDIGREGLLSH